MLCFERGGLPAERQTSSFPSAEEPDVAYYRGSKKELQVPDAAPSCSQIEVELRNRSARRCTRNRRICGLSDLSCERSAGFPSGPLWSVDAGTANRGRTSSAFRTVHGVLFGAHAALLAAASGSSILDCASAEHSHDP